MNRFLITFLLLASVAAAQTVGQYEIRKRTSTGFTSYGVTLSNGQVIGQTAGVPAAIAVSGGGGGATAWGDITGTLANQTDLGTALGLKLSIASAASTYEPILAAGTTGQYYRGDKSWQTLNASAVGLGNVSNALQLVASNNLSDLASASTARTNLGLGAAAILNTSTTGSAGAVAVYGALGTLTASSSVTATAAIGSNTGAITSGGFRFFDGTNSLSVGRAALTADRQIDFPNIDGTIITTGNLSSITTVGTVTGGTWQGGVIAPAYLGTGISIGTKFLRGDGTWQAVTGTGDMTRAVYDSQNLGLISGLQGSGGGGNSGGVGGSLDLSGGDSGITPNIPGSGVGGTGGNIHTYGGSGFTTDPAANDYSGGNGGYIKTTGSDAVDGAAGAGGGSIDTSALGGQAGGSIDTSAGGGSIDTHSGGGSINTRGTGSIEFGVAATRTTLVGSATAARTITMPNVTGTLITTGDSGTVTNAMLAGSINLATKATGTLPIANGGTGQTTQTAAFDALAPTTTKGDIIVSNGTDNIQLAVGGTNGHVLTVDSAEATGIKWAASSGLMSITESLATASPNNTVNAAALAVTGGTTNADLALSPKGTGALLAQIPDSTTTAGNKRGTYAVDWQIIRGAAADVASGIWSTISGGKHNKASAQYATVVGGYGNIASGENAVAGGWFSTASGASTVALGYQHTVAGNYAAALGGIQHTASGAQSVVAGGYTNTSSGQESAVLGGLTNTASATHSVVIGGTQGKADRQGMVAHSAGMFAAQGDAQDVSFVLRTKTTTNAAVEMYLNGSSVRLTIPSGKVLHATVKIVGVKSDGTAVATYLRQVCIKNVAGTTALVGSVITLGTDEAAGTSVSITASDTNDALIISPTGITSETWRWVAVVEGVEVAYGT